MPRETVINVDDSDEEDDDASAVRVRYDRGKYNEDLSVKSLAADRYRIQANPGDDPFRNTEMHHFRYSASKVSWFRFPKPNGPAQPRLLCIRPRRISSGAVCRCNQA